MRKLILLAATFIIIATSAVSGQSAKQKAAIEQEIRQLETAHADAIVRGDLAALDKIWTTDFTVNNPFNETDEANRIRTGAVTYSSFVREPESVQIHKNTVIVMGRETVVPKDNSPDAGKTINRRYTNIWMKRDGKWRLIARHASVIYSETQTKPEKIQSEQETTKPKIVALQSGQPDVLTYDAGTIRFLVSSEETNGAWSLVEVIEMPDYKTNFHRHNNTDEAFYVLEGILTVKINDKTSEYPAGSYVLIPRGTPHAQGNLGKIPVKFLLTMTPGGFEQSFKDRVELFKTIKPDNPDFRKMREENRIKGKYDVERLGDWDIQK